MNATRTQGLLEGLIPDGAAGQSIPEVYKNGDQRDQQSMRPR